MMSRGWRRLIREQGWMPIGIFAAVVLALLATLAMLVDEHNQLAEELLQKRTAVAAAKLVKERIPSLESDQKTTHASYGGVSSRLIQADASGDAGGAFSQVLRNWYGHNGIGQAAVLSVTPRQADGMKYLSAEIEAAMRIEQFAALMQSKLAAPLALRLVQATVEVDDVIAPSGLRTRMTWEGMQALPPVSVEKEKKPEKSDKTTLRAVNRGLSALPKSLAGDEKIK